jgi:hypothetical protein
MACNHHRQSLVVDNGVTGPHARISWKAAAALLKSAINSLTRVHPTFSCIYLNRAASGDQTRRYSCEQGSYRQIQMAIHGTVEQVSGGLR